jgi:DNA mismatch repair protein MutL
LISDLFIVGLEIEEFGKNTFIIRGIPANMQESEILQTIQYLIENIKEGESDINLKKNEKIARLVAQNLSIKSKRKLNALEINSIIDELFSCDNPFYTASGRPTIVSIGVDELINKFKI